MIYNKVILKRGKEDSLDRFHPWIFSGAIAQIDPKMEEGECVTVYTHDGRLIGNGHYQIGTIAIRILSFDEATLDKDFYIARLSDALRLRSALGLIRDNNNAFRLVHGEGDFLPGLIIDIYGSTAVLQAHTVGMHFARDIIALALTELDGLQITSVYYKSETTLPYKAQLDPQNDYIIGSFETNLCLENGLQFHIDWLKGQKTGFFIDQRENRSLLAQYAKGRAVLNMFCYTGGFSCYAMSGGACEVHSVDSSAKAIALTDANIKINFPDAEQRHTSFAEDAFRFLDSMERNRYDLIVLDPPAFAKHKGALKNALNGYKRLNYKAIEKIAPGGILFTFSCSQAVSREQFRLAVFSAAAMSKRRVRILHQLSQPADHPINIYQPEGEYLKGLVLYIE